MLQNLFVAAKVFAFVNLLFVPAIAGAVLIGFVLRDTYWFAFWSVPAFLVNGIAVFSRPSRRWVWSRVNTLAPLRGR